MCKDYKKDFVIRYVLGRDINLENPDEVFYRCVSLAYKDMMTAGRFYLSKEDDEKKKTDDKEKRCKKLVELLKNNNYQFSRQIIDDVSLLFGTEDTIQSNEGDSDNKYATRFGLSQKLVNMTFKYLFVFNEYIDKVIDFSNCDCPLDSVILGKISKICNPWSKITKEEYEECQYEIQNELEKIQLEDELVGLGNLSFDFLNW